MVPRAEAGRAFQVGDRPVPQEIGEQFLAGGVGDIRIVAPSTVRWGHGARDGSRLHPGKIVEGAQPGDIALNQVVVNGNDMGGKAGPAREDGGQTGGEGLTFSGSHLRQETAV